MPSKFLVPFEVPDFQGTPSSTADAGYVLLFIKSGWLTSQLPDGTQVDLVLQRPLDGFTQVLMAEPVTEQDTVLSALEKIQKTLSNIRLTGDVTGTGVYDSGELIIETTGGGINCAELLNCQVIIDMQGNITTLQSDVTSIYGSIDIILADIINLQGSVTVLETAVTTLQDDVVTIYGITSDLDGRVTTLENAPAPTKAATELDAYHFSGYGTQYAIGDLVYYQGHIYSAIATNDGVTPAIGGNAYWADLGTGNRIRQILADWNATTGEAQVLNKPTLLSQFTNDLGFLLEEVDTLDSVVTRGNLTAQEVTLDGKVNLVTEVGTANVVRIGHQDSPVAFVDIRPSYAGPNIGLYVQNPGLTGNSYAFIAQAQQTNAATNNIAGYFNAQGGATNVAIRTDYGNNLLNALGGNLLVGTTVDAGYKLDVNGAIRTQDRIVVPRDAAYGTRPFLYNSDGNALISTVSNDQLAQIATSFPWVRLNGIPVYGNWQTGSYPTGGTLSAIAVTSGINIYGTGSGFIYNASGELRTQGAAQASAFGFDGTLVSDLSGQILRGFYFNPSTISVVGTIYAFESTAGKIKISDLAGTGTRYVTADPNGVLGVSSSGFTEVDTLDSVTSRGEITTNKIEIGGIYATSGRSTILESQLNYFVHKRLNSSGVMGFKLNTNGVDTSFWRWNDASGDVEFGNMTNYGLNFYTNNALVGKFFNTGNLSIGPSPVDAGYKLDVNGWVRFGQDPTSGQIEFYPDGSGGATYSVYKSKLGSGLGPTVAFYGDVSGTYKGYGIYGPDVSYDGLLIYRETGTVADVILLGADKIVMPYTQVLGWTSSTLTFQPVDIALARSGVNLLEINTGTVGSLASLKLKNATVNDLAGTGTRMVVADATGLLGTQAIPTGGSGTVTSVALATGTSGTNINVSGSPITSSGTITLNIPDASTTARGVLTTGTQTIAGQKTFYSLTTIFDSAFTGTFIEGRASGVLYGGIVFSLFMQFNAYPAATQGFLWKNGAGNNVMALEQSGALTVLTLAGTGTRMVVANFAGVLSTQAIPEYGLQDVIINDAILTQTNTVDVDGFDFTWDNAGKYMFNASKFLDVNIDDSTQQARITASVFGGGDAYVSLSATNPSRSAGIDVSTAGVFIKTLNYSTSTAGDVLTLVDPVSGEVEFQTPSGGPGGGIALTDLSATAPVQYDNTTGVFSITQATTSTDGYLSAAHWNTFNDKQEALVSGTNIKTIHGDSILGSGNELIYMMDRAKYAFEYFNDFNAVVPTTNATDGRGYFGIFSGTGTALAPSATPAVRATNQQGFVQFATGTTATGYAGIVATNQATNFFIMGGGELVFETSLFTPILSDSTQRYRVVAGFGNQTNANAETNGIFFTYDEGATANGAVASGFWQCISAAGSVRTQTTTTVSATTGAWIKFKIVINAAGTSAAYYINDTLEATHTTNLPSGTAQLVVPRIVVAKTVGTTARSVYADYFGYRQTYTTSK